MFRKTLAYCYRQIFNRKILDVVKNLKKSDILATDENLAIQIKSLKKVLQNAASNIPYYSLEFNLDLDNLTYDNFRKLPILTKAIIRENSGELLNSAYKNIDTAVKNTSGGSTGEPVEFYRTEEQAVHGMANYYYALYLNKVDIFDCSVDLWGAERDMYGGSKFNFKFFLQNKYMLNTFVLSDAIIKEYVDRLNRIKPKFIKAYVHSIYDMARYINRNNIKINFAPVIHCTTGPLYPEMRDEIKRAFNQAHVYNFYGSREVSAIATEASGHDGMNVLFDNVFVEILDDNDEPVGIGQEGNIVITTLNNDYMPLIRYKIGDRGIKGDDVAFGTLKLTKVVGRTLGVIYKKNGTKLDGQFFTTLFFNKKGIKNFQLIQETLNKLTVNIVKTELYDEDELNKILERINIELGTDVDVDLHFVPKIDLTSTGKIMYVYSKLDK
ncbi:phenylacetate--CoA ligase family protein [Sphingobacterium suaedae]|uniref:Phenylacetate--CoA ligase family protein n=1 Tax=Sphingobacterium suaedae TaxID=1686402 RepID=A0ABW5KP85_9SPHI